MEKPRVLLVDDDANLRRAVSRLLEADGIAVCCASSGEAALASCRENAFSLILLDVSLGQMSGFDVLERLQAEGNRAWVVMLSGRRDDLSKVHALGLGADNYIEKPFLPHVLVSQVKAMLRRIQLSEAAPGENAVGDFFYNRDDRRIYRSGEPLPLTGREKELLLYFMRHPLHVVTLDELDAQVWSHAAVDDGTMIRALNQLRKKIGDDPANPVCLQTVRGVGYRFVPWKDERA